MLKIGQRVRARGVRGEIIGIFEFAPGDFQYAVRVEGLTESQLFERDELWLERERESGQSGRLSQLIERLWVHDELTATGLDEQWIELEENSTWDDAPGAATRREEKLRELADIAALILGAYEEV